MTPDPDCGSKLIDLGVEPRLTLTAAGLDALGAHLVLGQAATTIRSLGDPVFANTVRITSLSAAKGLAACTAMFYNIAAPSGAALMDKVH
nr:hypothetical protein [Phytoactinopolyspora halophila]